MLALLTLLNVWFDQTPDQWFIYHGNDVLFQGDGVMPSPLPAPIQAAVDYWDTIPAPQNKPAHAPSSSDDGVGKQISVTYSQNSPFNDLTPVYEGEHAPIGCVNTTYLQLTEFWWEQNAPVSYNKWGDTGTSHYWEGSEFEASYAYNFSEPQEGQGTFSWSYLPDKFYNYYSDNEFDYSAALSYYFSSEGYNDLGQLALYYALVNGTYFQTGGSATNSIYAANNFDKLGFRHAYCNDEAALDTFICHNIDRGYPVVVNGWNHSFIIDGYRDLQYHVNLGWGEGSVVWASREMYVLDHKCDAYCHRPKGDAYVLSDIVENPVLTIYEDNCPVGKTYSSVVSWFDGFMYFPSTKFCAGHDYTFEFQSDGHTWYAPFETFNIDNKSQDIPDLSESPWSFSCEQSCDINIIYVSAHGIEVYLQGWSVSGQTASGNIDNNTLDFHEYTTEYESCFLSDTIYIEGANHSLTDMHIGKYNVLIPTWYNDFQITCPAGLWRTIRCYTSAGVLYDEYGSCNVSYGSIHSFTDGDADIRFCLPDSAIHTITNQTYDYAANKWIGTTEQTTCKVIGAYVYIQLDFNNFRVCISGFNVETPQGIQKIDVDPDSPISFDITGRPATHGFLISNGKKVLIR